MGDLEESWTVLLGHQPTDHDKQNLYRIRDATKLKPTDAVWQLLIAFQYYEKLYEQFPSRIAAAARDVTRDIRATAEVQAKAAREETKRGLTEAVREAVVKSSQDMAGAEVVKWMSVAAGIVSVALVLLHSSAVDSGERMGMAAGENAAKKECAALVALSSWGLTPEGQVAYALAKAGGLADVARCTGRGMIPKDGWCTVQSERGKPLARWPIAPVGTESSGAAR